MSPRRYKKEETELAGKRVKDLRLGLRNEVPTDKLTSKQKRERERNRWKNVEAEIRGMGRRRGAACPRSIFLIREAQNES